MSDGLATGSLDQESAFGERVRGIKGEGKGWAGGLIDDYSVKG